MAQVAASSIVPLPETAMGEKMDANEEAAARQMAQQMQSQQDQQSQAEEKKQQMEQLQEQRRVMLRQILEPAAAERLASIGLVKPEKKQMVENFILQQAQRESFARKIDENVLKQILEKVGEAEEEKKGKIQFQRKRHDDSDDDYGIEDL
mmetsp:Transcript_60229/g.135764  ORF Transcript_60229/g.135764 Transcript_60229/m.135764 type:complete len:150 (-) Transcript_60229:106-555(-)